MHKTKYSGMVLVVFLLLLTVASTLVVASLSNSLLVKRMLNYQKQSLSEDIALESQLEALEQATIWHPPPNIKQFVADTLHYQDKNGRYYIDLKVAVKNKHLSSVVAVRQQEAKPFYIKEKYIVNNSIIDAALLTYQHQTAVALLVNNIAQNRLQLEVVDLLGRTKIIQDIAAFNQDAQDYTIVILDLYDKGQSSHVLIHGKKQYLYDLSKSTLKKLHHAFGGVDKAYPFALVANSQTIMQPMVYSVYQQRHHFTLVANKVVFNQGSVFSSEFQFAIDNIISQPLIMQQYLLVATKTVLPQLSIFDAHSGKLQQQIPLTPNHTPCACTQNINPIQLVHHDTLGNRNSAFLNLSGQCYYANFAFNQPINGRVSWQQY